MTSHHALHHRSTSPDIVGLARQLLGAAPYEPTRCDRSPATTRDRADIDELLLQAAFGVLAQFRVLSDRCRLSTDQHQVIADVYATAESHSVAPVGAIGVTGTLAGQLRQPCEMELASTLARARAAFTDEELLDGAAALCAATAWHLGERLGVDPLVVIDEVYGRRASEPGTHRHRCHRHLHPA